MTPTSVPAGAKPTAPAGAPPRHAPLRPDSSRRGTGWGDTASASEWAEPEPAWEPWPFPDEEPSEAEPDGPVFVDRSGRRRRIAVLVGSSAAVVIVVALVMLVAGLSGVAPLSVPGFPDLAKPAPPPVVASTGAPGDRPAAPGPAATLTVTPSASPAKTSPRHIPTQTPSRSPRPTK